MNQSDVDSIIRVFLHFHSMFPDEDRNTVTTVQNKYYQT